MGVIRLKKMEEQNGIWAVHNSAKMEMRGVKGSLVISMCFRVNLNYTNALELVRKRKGFELRELRSCCKVKGILVISLILYFEVWFNAIKVNVMWLGENECVWWIKWKLWLMCSCGFLEKC